jgi:hypothetical protein
VLLWFDTRSVTLVFAIPNAGTGDDMLDDMLDDMMIY